MFIFYYFFYITLPKSNKKTLQLIFLCELFFLHYQNCENECKKVYKITNKQVYFDIVSISLNPKNVHVCA